MTDLEVESKIKHILLEISKTNPSEGFLLQIISHSSFIFETHWNNHSFPNLFNLKLIVTPDVFTKNYSMIKHAKEIIKHRISDTSGLIIDKILILPDYDKLQTINSKVITVFTEWEEINQLQQKLIEGLKKSNEPIDYQAIGLTSRTIMNKLAQQVFDVNKHKPKIDGILLSNGNFKNQLHTFIEAVLSGESNQQFRQLAKSSINLVEDSIDFMNKTTHKLDAEKHLAEVCVISTISSISVINLIKQLEITN